MNRAEFFDRLSTVDEATLKKALWTAYWRGSASARELIEDALDPSGQSARVRKASQRPDAKVMAAEVAEFAELARQGAYLGRDRRVFPKERTRWRHTYRRLAKEATEALAGEDVDTAASAMETLIALACEAKYYEYFRSEDPVEAARFVVSDAAAALWSVIRRQHGFAEFSSRAASQLVRWEYRFGWTRFGYGWVSERETSLAHVVARMLPSLDAWGRFADDYLRGLDSALPAVSESGRDSFRRNERTGDLAEWHRLLIERLVDSDYEDRLDVLVHHPKLSGPERTFLQARLARWRGEQDEARRLVDECLRILPGHTEFRAFADELSATDS